jgi:mono/diheme cytochrome c family protein
LEKLRLLFSLLVVVFVFSSWEALSGNKSSTLEAKPSDGLTSWEKVYSVLTSPRCINCHTATTYPQQGDDRHRHFANVVRGLEGKGVPALQCATCHQAANGDSTGVPGANGWHLAPLSMRWQDRNDKPLSSAAVCRSVKSQKVDLIKHHSEEPLVLWAFTPGLRSDGTARTLPPLMHAEFLDATRRWVEAGKPCPTGGQQ